MNFMKKGMKLKNEKLKEEQQKLIQEIHQIEGKNTKNNSENSENSENEEEVDLENVILFSEKEMEKAAEDVDKLLENSEIFEGFGFIEKKEEVKEEGEDEIVKKSEKEKGKKKAEKKVSFAPLPSSQKKRENPYLSEQKPKKQKKEKLKTKEIEVSDEDSDSELLSGLSQKKNSDFKEKVRKAFEGGEQEEEFFEEIQKIENEKIEKIKELESKNALPGWGEDWTGAGIKNKKIRKADLEKELQNSKNKEKSKKSRVIVYDESQKISENLTSDSLPMGFKNNKHFEKSLATPLGSEWNTPQVHQRLIQPKIVTRVGAVLPPLQMAKKLTPMGRERLLEAWSQKKTPNRTRARF